MDTINTRIDQAESLRNTGKLEDALKAYSEAFDLLIDQAGAYAQEIEKDTTDKEELRAIAPRLFEHSKEYLRRTLHASSILNSMGLLFRELGEYENAKQKFQEAIEYIPKEIEYDDPSTHLQEVNEFLRLHAAAQTETHEEI